MIKMFLPGQNVPDWLAGIEILKGGYLGSFKFSNVCFVWLYKDEFHVLNLLPAAAMIIKNSDHVKIIGRKGGVRFRGTLIDVAANLLLK